MDAHEEPFVACTNLTYRRDQMHGYVLPWQLRCAGPSPALWGLYTVQQSRPAPLHRVSQVDNPARDRITRSDNVRLFCLGRGSWVLRPAISADPGTHGPGRNVFTQP